MRRLTVVGCGWFGLAFALRGVQRGWDVCGSVRDPERARDLGTTGIRGFPLELSASEYPRAPFAERLVLVAVPPGRSPDRIARYEAGVLALLEHAVRCAAQGVVFISSTSVYRGLTGELDEACVPQDTSLPLVRLERALASAPVPTCAVRFGGLVGPGRNPGRFLAGRRDLENGAHPVNLVAREDCLAAVELLLDRPPGEWPSCVNVVSPEHPTRAAFYTRAAEQLGLDPPTFLRGSSEGGRIVRCSWLAAQGFAFSTPIDRQGARGS